MSPPLQFLKGKVKHLLLRARSGAGHLSLLSLQATAAQLTLPCVVHGSAGCFQLDHAKGIAGLESILGSLATEHQVQRKLEKCSRSQREHLLPLCSPPL